MFDLIDGLSGLMGDLSQSSPNEKGTRNVVSHNACQSALTLFKPRYLFCFPVNLLNLPTQVAHLLVPPTGRFESSRSSRYTPCVP